MGYGLGYGLRIAGWRGLLDYWSTEPDWKGVRLLNERFQVRALAWMKKKDKYKNILQSQVQWKKTCGSNGVFLDVAQW